MTVVYWLAVEAASLPASDDWLSAEERRVLAGLRVPKRRADWRLGRFAAKRALAAAPGLLADAAPAARTIAAAADGAPEVRQGGLPAPCALSISHAGGRALCAVSASGVALGCDIEVVAPRAPAFVGDFFTPAERARVAAAPDRARDRLVTLLWSAKESALKALRAGLRRDTREVEVVPPEIDAPGSWRALAVHCAGDGRLLHGYGGACGGFVATIVADPRPSVPVSLARRAQEEAVWGA